MNKACDIVASCEWQGGSSRQRKLTKFTASAFVVTTKNAIFASNYLLENFDFQYILPAVFSTNPLEKFFGQSRQRVGGNFDIDVVDVILAAKVQRLHQLIKNAFIPTPFPRIVVHAPLSEKTRFFDIFVGGIVPPLTGACTSISGYTCMHQYAKRVNQLIDFRLTILNSC